MFWLQTLVFSQVTCPLFHTAIKNLLYVTWRSSKHIHWSSHGNNHTDFVWLTSTTRQSKSFCAARWAKLMRRSDLHQSLWTVKSTVDCSWTRVRLIYLHKFTKVSVSKPEKQVQSMPRRITHFFMFLLTQRCLNGLSFSQLLIANVPFL